MAIEWKNLAKEEPQDNQACWITGGEYSQIIGPLPWKAETKGFLDFFATPEAGAIYNANNGVTHWCDKDQINMPD